MQMRENNYFNFTTSESSCSLIIGGLAALGSLSQLPQNCLTYRMWRSDPQCGSSVRLTALQLLAARNENKECYEARKKHPRRWSSGCRSEQLSEIYCVWNETMKMRLRVLQVVLGLPPHSEQQSPSWWCQLVATGRMCCIPTAGCSALGFLQHSSALLQVSVHLRWIAISALETQYKKRCAWENYRLCNSSRGKISSWRHLAAAN